MLPAASLAIPRILLNWPCADPVCPHVFTKFPSGLNFATRSDRATGTVSFDVQVTNVTAYDLRVPLLLVLDPSRYFQGTAIDPYGLVRTADEIIAGYKQLIDRARMRSIKVIGSPLAPFREPLGRLRGSPGECR